MMDFIYGCEDRLAPPPAEQIGRYVFDYTTRVRRRKEFVPAALHGLADRSPG